MNTKITVVLAILLVIAGGFYLNDYKKGLEHERSLDCFTLDRTKLTSISLYSAGNLSTFTKKGELWFSPENYPLSPEVSDKIISLIYTIKKQGTVSEEGDKRSFGLQPALSVISITDSDKKTESVSIGKKNFDGLSMYAIKDGSSEIFKVSSVGMDYLMQPLNTYLSNYICFAPIENLKKVEIKKGNSAISCEEQSGIATFSKGKIEQRFAFSKKALNNLLETLSSIEGQFSEQIQKFVPVGDPKLSFKLTTSVEDSISIYLAKTGYICHIVREKQFDFYMHVQKSDVEPFLSLDLNRLEDKCPIDFEPSLLDSVSIIRGNEQLSLKQIQAQWSSSTGKISERFPVFLWHLSQLSLNRVQKLPENSKQQMKIGFHSKSSDTEATFYKTDSGYIISSSKGFFVLENKQYNEIISLLNSVLK